MQRSTLFVLLATSGLLTCGTQAGAQQAGIMKQVFAVEGAMEQPVVSPNGRWVVYRIPGPNGTGSRIWLGSTNGGKPWPLTSEGYDDVVPRWAPAGDRLVFTSTRPNRNGGSKHFAMVLDIDAATGKASGPPRQVSLEPAEGAAMSFDGRWVAYTQRDSTLRLKLVPSNGGTARLAAEIPGLETPFGFGGLTFDKTGSSVYISTFKRAAGGGVRLWRIPAADGRPEVLVETDHPILILPADPRYVIHYEMSPSYSMGGPGIARLTTIEGKEVGRIAVPAGLFANLNGGDAWGFTAQVTNSPGEVRVLDLANGIARTIAVGSHWPEAWMPDGSAVITDRRDVEKGGFIVETVPLVGGDRRSVSVNGEVEAGGWSTAMGPYYSYRQRGPDQQAKTGPTRLFSLDVRSGESRRLADAAMQRRISGPGGFENDGPRWMYTEMSGDRLLLRSVDPGTGETRTIRSFPKSATQGPLAVHGTRVAWLAVHGDSTRLILAEGDEPDRVLATFPFKGESAQDNRLAWSRSGREIAVSIHSEGTRSGLSVVEVPTDRAQPARRRDFPVAFSYCCDQIQWLPDDSALLGIAGNTVPSSDASLLLFPVRSGGQPRPLASDVTSWEFILSPDGKHAVYQRERVTSSTIWIASFKNLVSP